MNPIRHLVAVALATLSLGAFAHGSTPLDSPRIDARQARQAARIDHGLARGALTRHEARHLWRMQARIARAERHAKADGVLTRHERAYLTRLQDRASRHIRHETHDAERARRGDALHSAPSRSARARS